MNDEALVSSVFVAEILRFTAVVLNRIPCASVVVQLSDMGGGLWL